MMEFAVGASVEAVDQLGFWSKAKSFQKLECLRVFLRCLTFADALR